MFLAILNPIIHSDLPVHIFVFMRFVVLLLLLVFCMGLADVFEGVFVFLVIMLRF